jgi:glycosidase
MRDIDLMNKGWFARQMPDLNQQNPFVAKYLLQNTIWWIEYAGLNGFRMDTHPYSDKQFMAKWCKAILHEYPNFSIVGETWYTSSASVSYWQKDARNADGYNSHLPSVMDFPLMNAINKAFDEEDGWETGIARLYDVLTQDFVYANSNNLFIFIDNHDKGRFQTDTTLDVSRLKLAMAFLLTTRGIPQIYYGTEILLPGDVDKGGHGDIRRDFPGGWETDSRSAFNANGRTPQENEIWNYVSRILHWRKGAAAIH